jgi:hypothetical protein
MSRIEIEPQVGGLVASAVLIDLNISMWAGRKTARDVTDKVVAENNAKARDAAHVTKKLFVDNPKFAEIGKAGNRIRNYVNAHTLPWMGDMRLLPIAQFMEFTDAMNDMKGEFEAAVDSFLTDYSTAVRAMAFKLGNLFDRNEYPDAAHVRAKFDVQWRVCPVPTAGDFRVDAENRLKQELAEQYGRALNERIAEAMAAMWGRLHECLTHMKERLDYKDDGKPNVFRDSMLENAHELLSMLRALNVTGDPKMESARRDLAAALAGVEAQELRKNEKVREDVRARVSDILASLPPDLSSIVE